MFYCRILSLLSLFSLTVISANENDFQYEDNVLVLTDRNLQNVLEEKGYIVVDFYTDWCMHCIGLARHWIHIAKLLKEKNSTVTMAKANCGVEKEMKARFKITDYPSIKIMKKNRIWDYEGRRGLDEILSWIEEKTEVKTKILSSENEIEIFRESSSSVAIAAMLGDNTEERKIFLSAAQDYDKVLFGEIKDPEVAKSVGLSDKGIVIYKRLLRDVYTGSLTDEIELKRWLLQKTWVLLQEMNDESAPEIFDDAIEIHNILFMKKSDKEFEELYSNFEKAASGFIGQVRFVFVDAGDNENDRVMEFFGVKKETCPTYRVINMNEDMAKYMPEHQDLSSAAVANYTRLVFTGKAKRYLSTQEIPKDWDKGSVIELVGKNFAEIAYQSNKNVFVYFYDPWCFHCKKANDAFKDLGEYYKGHPDVVIAKMDATTNEVEDIKVISFPTFYYFPASSKNEFSSYEGERTLEAMVHYIESSGGMEDVEGYYSDQKKIKLNDDLSESKQQEDSVGGNETPQTQTSEETKDTTPKPPTADSPDTTTHEENFKHARTEEETPQNQEEQVTPTSNAKKAVDDSQKQDMLDIDEKDRERIMQEFNEKIASITPDVLEGDMMRELEKILPDMSSSELPGYELSEKIKEKLKEKAQQKEEL